MAEGWGVAPAFHLPATVTGHLRIGKEATPPTFDESAAAPVLAETLVGPDTENTHRRSRAHRLRPKVSYLKG